MELTGDVPQGSILGPLLFIMYVNDFKNIFSDKSKQFTISYADGTNLLPNKRIKLYGYTQIRKCNYEINGTVVFWEQTGFK